MPGSVLGSGDMTKNQAKKVLYSGSLKGTPRRAKFWRKEQEGLIFLSDEAQHR